MIIWAAICPLVSLLVEDLRRTVLRFVGFVLLLIVSAILQPYLTPAGLPEAFVTWFFVLNLGSVIAIVFALSTISSGSETSSRNARRRCCSISSKGNLRSAQNRPERHRYDYEFASVLFADVVEFTPMAATMTPLRLVNLLNDVFHCFDDLVEKHDLEKIKTIGDCYMVAAGVPRERPTTRPSRAACDRHARGGGDADIWRSQARVSHRHQLGPVVAGVIGRQVHLRPLGAAVNLASRMEFQGRERNHPNHPQHPRPDRGPI